MNKPILVVEDNPDNMYVLDHVLTRHGYQVVQAINGADALMQIGKIDPALVLLDMQMPGLNGYATVEEIRRHRQFADLPVIAVTASSMPGDRERAIEAGCTDYLAKPINPREMLRVVGHYLDLGGAAGDDDPDR